MILPIIRPLGLSSRGTLVAHERQREDRMTRFVARSLFLIGAAVGCAPQNGIVDPPSSGAAGTGPVVITGAGAMCGGGFASGGAKEAFPGMVLPPGFGSPSTPQPGVTHTATEAPPAI